MTDSKNASIKAIVVDDESLSRDVVKHMLESHPDIETLRECANGIEALEAIKELQPMLIFLDIRMPGLSGIELVESLKDDYHPIIVFITAYDQYAIKAFEQNAVDYLLKPFDQERFDQMIDRARQRFAQRQDAAFARRLKGFLEENVNLSPSRNEQQPNVSGKGIDRIVVKESGRVFFVSPQEVDHFEASGNYVALHVKDKTHLVYDTLTKMEEKLDTSRFLRIHRSTIVNISRIKEMLPHFNGEYIIVLKNDTRLKLSRSYREKAKACLGLE